jgi:ADP-heptose:LPS heptosyltransferase
MSRQDGVGSLRNVFPGVGVDVENTDSNRYHEVDNGVAMKRLARPLIAGMRLVFRDGHARPFRPERIRSLLLVELTRLGDAVTLLHLLKALREALPRAEINAIVEEPFVGLLQVLGPGIGFHGINRPDRIPGVLRAIATARRLRADIAVSVSPAYRNAAVVLASGSEFRAGYLKTGGSAAPSLVANPVEGFGFAAPQGITFYDEGWIERRWKLLELLGIRSLREPGTFALPRTVQEEGMARLRERNLVNGRPHIVVHPFSSWGFRSWPAPKFLALIDRILAEFDHDVVVLGGRDETEGLNLFRERFGSSGRVSCLASDTFFESAILIGTATLLVGNDSGPLHLASVLGTPALGVYGPSDPRHTAPPSVKAIYHRVECSPCRQQRCVRPEDPCLSGVSVDEVMVSLAELLRSRRSGREN